MTPPRMPNLRTLRRATLVSLALLSGASLAAPSAAQDMPRPGFAFFHRSTGGAPGDMLIRWQADCTKDDGGTFAKTAAVAAALQLDATQQAALNAYLGYVCTLPTFSGDDPATLETDARLNMVAQHMESEAQKLRLQAEQFRKFVNTLSVAQQLLFREQFAGRPPF